MCKLYKQCKKQGTAWCGSCIYGNDESLKSQYEDKDKKDDDEV